VRRHTVRWGARRLIGTAGAGALAAPVLLFAAVFGAAPAHAAAGPSPTAPGIPSNPRPAPGKITVQKDQWGDSKADDVSDGAGTTYDAARDPGSLYTVTRAIGARSTWAQKDAAGRAVTGQGVTVAVLDSGVAPVAGLTGDGKLVQGPDLSLENDNPSLVGLDTFGHGTHLSAIIAGADPTATDRSGLPKDTVPGDQLGVAPGAGLLSLKLATANGTTDVSQVIAGLDWVAEHAQDPGRNVRVVNLSFGTDSLQPYQVDPLAAAAENAWRHGLVVVVSGGNEGPAAGRLTDPAMDPYVIAVGASDPNLAVDGWKQPTVAAFSNGGTAQRHVDLLAPGRSITSLRDPGSFIDVHHPEGLVAGDTSGRLFRGSGTSQAAAVVSGAAALLLQLNPSLTPDQVKAALTRSAHPLPGVPTVEQGAGQLDVAAADDLVKPGKGFKLTGTAQTAPAATGVGSLEASRGGTDLVDPDTGVTLSGEVDVQGHPFDAPVWAAASAAGSAWDGGIWNSARWSGDTWSSARWSDAEWASARWSSARWSDTAWASARWSDTSWDSARWSSARWSSARWSSARWSGIDWDSARWSSARWSSAQWSSALWSSARWSPAGWFAGTWSAGSWSARGWNTGPRG